MPLYFIMISWKLGVVYLYECYPHCELLSTWRHRKGLESLQRTRSRSVPYLHAPNPKSESKMHKILHSDLVGLCKPGPVLSAVRVSSNLPCSRGQGMYKMSTHTCCTCIIFIMSCSSARKHEYMIYAEQRVCVSVCVGVLLVVLVVGLCL